MMGEMCNDGRFEEIKETKDYIIRATNIDTSEEEMNVLDQICFRLWQLGLTKKNKDEFKKIKNILEEYNVTPEILRDVLLKGQMARHNPTLEEVKKEWEELGYKQIKDYDCFHLVKKMNNNMDKNKTTYYHFEINEDYYVHYYSYNIQESLSFVGEKYVCVIKNKEHQLLTKTFRALGWFDE